MKRMPEIELNDFCLCLQSDEKKKRQKGLEKLLEMIKNEEMNWSKEEILEIWQIIGKNIAKHLTDPSECCRNLSIEISKVFVKLLPVLERNIIYLIPVLVNRLSPQETLEPSEEIRLNYIYLLRLIINIYKKYLSVYIDDFTIILIKTVKDNYPNVKKESCLAISDLAKTIPAEFYTKSDTFINPILSNFNHQHYRVRVMSVNTIGDVLLYGNSKSMENVATPLAERLFDQSATVRAAVVEVAGNWLLHLPDRYSWWCKLIPLVLTGLHDEISEIRVKAAELWDSIGLKYLKENETDDKIKDKMDFLKEHIEHYPPHIKRPNLGCRIIVQQNIGKLVSGIAKELGDWLADIRVRSAQLLAVLVLNAEEDVVQHMTKLLPPMYRACNDSDLRIVDNIILAAEYMGYFVPPEIYCRLIFPSLNDENITAGHLTVIASILNGSNRKLLSIQLEEIGDFLQKPHICQSKKINYQNQMLRCCEALLNVCQQDCNKITNDLFMIIFTSWSMSHAEEIHSFAKKLMVVLSETNGYEQLDDFYSDYVDGILHFIDKSANELWSIHTPEFHLLKNCLTEIKTAIWKHLDVLLNILMKIMNVKIDSELQVKLFILLSEFFQSTNENHCEAKYFQVFVNYIDKIVIPGLIWSAGRTAETIRTAAVGCLCALLEISVTSIENNKFNFQFDENNSIKQKLSLKFDEIKPILISLTDDNPKSTRLFALKAIYNVIRILKDMKSISEEIIMTLYPVVIKRLDDGCDDVRCTAVETLVTIWGSLPNDFDVNFGINHVDYLYTSTIIHLDDPEPQFQDLMLDGMIKLAEIHPELLAKKIEKCKGNFRNQKGLDKLLQQCYELLSKKDQTNEQST